MKYIDEAKLNIRIFAKQDITEEYVVRQQMHRLLDEMPYEDLIKIFVVTKERENFYGEDFLKIKVSIDTE